MAVASVPFAGFLATRVRFFEQNTLAALYL